MTKSTKKKVAVGVGVATAAAAAAGYYFFGSKNAKKNREGVARWATRLKSDVVKKTKSLKDINQESVKKIVKQAAKAYTELKSVSKNDLQGAVVELEKHWKDIKKEAESLRKPVKKVAAKSSRKK